MPQFMRQASKPDSIRQKGCVRLCVCAGGFDEKNKVEWRKKTTNLFLRLERFIKHPQSNNIFVQQPQRTPPRIWLRQEKVKKKLW